MGPILQASHRGTPLNNEKNPIFQEALSIWRAKHPSLVSPSDWSKPERERNLLEYCEWGLWQAAYINRLGGSRFSQEQEDWYLGFYLKVASSEAIRQVCQAQCKSREHADALLGLLFRESDRMRPNRPADDPVFPGLLREQINREQDRKHKEEQKRFRGDLRQFAAIKAASAQLCGPYGDHERAELQQALGTFEKYERKAQQGSAPHLGPDCIWFEGMTVSLSRDRATIPLTTRRGRLALDNASKNIYFELVRRLVRNTYQGPDEVEKAVELIQHFSPGLLSNTYDVNRLGARLKPFLEKDGVRGQVNGQEDYYVNQYPFTTLLTTIHPPLS